MILSTQIRSLNQLNIVIAIHYVYMLKPTPQAAGKEERGEGEKKRKLSQKAFQKRVEKEIIATVKEIELVKQGLKDIEEGKYKDFDNLDAMFRQIESPDDKD
jgi:hypothetical protein